MALTTCSECGREVSDQATACPGCGAPLNAPAQTPPLPPRSSPDGMPLCQACGSPMKKKIRAPTEGIGCLIILAGVPVFLFVPGGWLFGPILGLIGFLLANRRKGVWRCGKCGAEIARHMKWYEI